MAGRVTSITIAPVKGLALVGCQAVDLTEDGVEANRRFHLIDERGALVNGKRVGPLVAVRPELEDGGTLTLTFPDGGVVRAPVELGEPIGSRFYGRMRPGRLVAGPFSAALSAFAGAELRLVQAARPGLAVDRGRGGAVSLLSDTAAEAHGLDPRRFRMLFGIGGVPAHAEDDWVGYRVRIGDAVIRPLGHTGRCLVTSQDPDTGIRDRDVLGLLREVRPDDTAEPLPFGVHGSVAQPGRVRVGDPVELVD